jgi:hypothetical protein
MHLSPALAGLFFWRRSYRRKGLRLSDGTRTIGAEKMTGRSAMATKTKATAAEIQAVMQNRFRESKELGGDCSRCHAPIPLPMSAMGPRAPNWEVGTIDGTPGCRAFILAIVVKAMGEFELIEG